MQARQTFLRLSVLTSLVLMTVPLASCEFCIENLVEDACTQMGSIPVKDVTSSNTQPIFEVQGTIAVFHGSACAQSNKSGREDAVKVEQSLELPSYARDATIFLNGWRVRYLSQDNHVTGFGAFIDNIKLDGGRLKWVAVGGLGDDKFDDGYSWCYNYTVVAWNPANLNLTVDHDGGCGTFGLDPTLYNFFIARNDGATTALSSYASFLQNPAFIPIKNVSVLPRGFGFAWGPKCDIDHHLLQVAYNLDHSERFIENDKKYHKRAKVMTPSLPTAASRASEDYVTWETSAIFKDNDGRRTYYFGEMVSALGGADVGVIQPPFSILPREDSSCTAVGPPPPPEEFVVENVPFQFAIPMLTGWELGYLCKDQHVKEGGIWIDTWSYDITARTLRYTLSSVLRYSGNDAHYRRHKVTILGLRPLAGGVIPVEKRPDLVPFSPSGNTADKFCRREQNGQLLRVTVKNQGNKDAGASKTTVTFANASITLNTPAIPAGGSTDLLFRFPSNCFGFSLDCPFGIEVDSDNQVNESSSEGNNSANGTCKVA